MSETQRDGYGSDDFAWTATLVIDVIERRRA